MNRLTARSTTRSLLGLLAALGLVGALTMPVLASDVTPKPINSGNPTCADFAKDYDATWTEFKLEGRSLADGEYTDGTLEVTISNFENNSFDWESNIGVDAVFVKAGSDKHNLYVYDPEATEDEGLKPQDGQGNGISHISFCYDKDADPSEPAPSEPAPSEPAPSEPAPSEPAPSEPAPSEPAPSESPEESELPSEGSVAPEQSAAPSQSVREGVQGGNPTPTPTGGELPDTAAEQFGQVVPAAVLSLMLLGALAAMAYLRLSREED